MGNDLCNKLSEHRYLTRPTEGLKQLAWVMTYIRTQVSHQAYRRTQTVGMGNDLCNKLSEHRYLTRPTEGLRQLAWVMTYVRTQVSHHAYNFHTRCRCILLLTYYIIISDCFNFFVYSVHTKINRVVL